MKKRTKVFVTIFSIPLLATCFGIDFPVTTGWMSLYIPPLEQEENLTINFVYRISSLRDGQVVNFQINLTNQFYPNKLLVFQDLETVQSGFTDIQRIFVLDHHFVSEGANTLSFEATINRITKTISVDAFYKTKATIKPEREGGEIYASPYNEISLSKGILTLKRDSFIFYDFNSIIESNYYHHLNLNALFFTSENMFSYESAVLRIKDEFGFYSRLNRGLAIGYREIPLTIDLDAEGKYRFSYGANLFVDPTTLLMSLSSRDGFIPTNTFYFPKERFLTESNLEMEIAINNCGINESTIIYDFSYISSLRFLGDCRDSMYCVSTTTCDDTSVFEDWETVGI